MYMRSANSFFRFQPISEAINRAFTYALPALSVDRRAVYSLQIILNLQFMYQF
jgi:hypothetical protein